MPTIDLDDLQIRYRLTRPRDGGAASLAPLVFLHGAAAGLYVWLEQVRALAEARPLLSFDFPGHGLSRPALSEISIESYAEVARTLVDALELPAPVWVGHSMGGAVAQTVALLWPERASGLVLLGTGARLVVSDLVFQALETQFEHFPAFVAGVAYSAATDPDRVARYTEGKPQVTQDVAIADFSACAAFDLRDRLSELTLPTLILAGADDALVGAGRAKQLEAGLPHAKLLTVADAGHMLMQEQPSQVNEALLQFLSANRL